MHAGKHKKTGQTLVHVSSVSLQWSIHHPASCCLFRSVFSSKVSPLFLPTWEEDGLPSSRVLWLAQTALSTAPDSLLASSLINTPGLHTLLYLDSRLPGHQETRFTPAPDFIWALWCTISWKWGLFSLFWGNLSHNVPAWCSGWLW